MSKSTQIALGKRIKSLRKENRLTQERFALMVDIERSYLSRLESGDRNPSLSLLERIAEGLDMTLSELLEGV